MVAADPDALLAGVLKRLASHVKPFLPKDRPQPTTALDSALVWTYKWSSALKKQRNTMDQKHLDDLAKCLRHVMFAWTVEHPKLFSRDADPDLLRSHKDEKAKVEAMVFAARELLQVLLHETVSEAVSPVKEAANSLADDTAWKDPRLGWQGVLLALLEGLCNHLETRNPAPTNATQNDMSAYRDFIGVELVAFLVRVVFPSKTGVPTSPGDPIKDYKGHSVLAPEVKYTALDVVIEALRRQIAGANALRNSLSFAAIGSVLYSGYDMHLCTVMIDVAYRLLPGRRKSRTHDASKRSIAIEEVFSDEHYGKQQAPELRKMFDDLIASEWHERSTKLLKHISASHIKRAQGFALHDFCYNGAHLLPAEPGKEGQKYESLTANDVIDQGVFVTTTVWLGRDSLTVLIDEPPECTTRRLEEEKRTVDHRPSAQPAETRDARAVVPFAVIKKVHVHQLDSSQDDYRITLLLDQALQIDGQPHPSVARHHGTAVESTTGASIGAPAAAVFHKLEMLMTTKKADLGLLKKVLEERSKRYPSLGEELDSFPVFLAPGGDDASATAPATRVAATSTAMEQPAAAAGSTSKSAAGQARTDARNGVPQAPQKSSQAKPLEVGGSSQGSEDDAEARADADNGPAPEEDATARETDLGRRRDELASMARDGSPATSATSSRRRSKEDEAAADTGPAANRGYDDDFGGGFEDEEAREAALDAQLSRKEQQSDDELPSPRRLGRSAAKDPPPDTAGVDELEEKQLDGADDAAKTTKSNQPAARQKPDEKVDMMPTARRARRGDSPVSDASVPLRRSARLSPQPAKMQGDKEQSRSRKVVVADEKAKESEPGEQSRPRRGAAQSSKKKIVQPAAKQKRTCETDEDDEESLTSQSEHSDSADDTFVGRRARKTVAKAGKARAPPSKRRKVDVHESDKDELSDKGDLTDYDEFSLPTKEQRRHKQKFGKTVGPLQSNGTTRKANQPTAKTPASKKRGKPGTNRRGKAGGSKAEGKAPIKPSSEPAERKRESGTDMSMDELDETAPTRALRAPRSAAKKVVAPTKGDATAASDEEEPLPMKKGDKRIADDIPPPADLTASEQLRIKRAGPKSPAKSPGKAKPVQTLDQLTGVASMPVEKPAEKPLPRTEAAEDVQDTSAEQQDLFEPDFEMPEADIADIEAVFGPAAERAASDAAPEHGLRQHEVPAAPPYPETVEAVPPALSTAKDLSWAPESDATRAANVGKTAERATSEVTAADFTPAASATGRTQGGVTVSRVAPADQIGAQDTAQVAAEPATPTAAHQNTNAIARPAPPPSAISAKTETHLRGRVQHDDSGVHFVANESDASKLQNKGGLPTAPQHLQAELMELDAHARDFREPGGEMDAPLATTKQPAVHRSPEQHHTATLPQSTRAATETRVRGGKVSRPHPRQHDVRQLQSTPVQPAAAKSPEHFLPWSAIPTRTAALRQGTSRAVEPPIPAGVGHRTQLASSSAAATKRAPANRPAANSGPKSAPPSRLAPARARPHAQAPLSYVPGSRSGPKSDRIVLEERPVDTYEEFFDVLVELSRAFVKKHREKADDLQRRREMGTQRVEQIVARNVQRDNAETREIAKLVAQRAATLDGNGASNSIRACAQDVGMNSAQIGAQVRDLLDKLAAEKLA